MFIIKIMIYQDHIGRKALREALIVNAAVGIVLFLVMIIGTMAIGFVASGMI